MTPSPRIGVSSCLLGEEVRYDGGHKRVSFLTSVLEPYVEWVRVCPEMEAGLGVPREPIRLVRLEGQVRLRGIESGRDFTQALAAACERRAHALREMSLDGYVLKSGSPSCGRGGLKTFAESGPEPVHRDGEGVFAAALRRTLPDLPVVEETDLEPGDPQTHFVERVFAHRRARRLFAGGETLREFHERHELQIVAHSAGGRKELARIAEAGGPRSSEEAIVEYSTVFSRALSCPATRQRQAGVLRRILSRLRERIPARSGDGLELSVRDFEIGDRSLASVRAELGEAAHGAQDRLLMTQTYLAPDPDERRVLSRLGAVAPGAR